MPRILRLAAALLLSACPPLQAAVFTVTNVGDSGGGSLRAAIEAANAAGAGSPASRAALGRGARTLAPTSALPAFTGAGQVLVDGRSQPGYAGTPLIRIDGAAAGDTHGLRLAGGAVRLRSLVVTRFARSGVVAGAGGTHVLDGVRIGASGTLRAGNGLHGVEIAGSGTRVDIGVATDAGRSVIACNGGDGVLSGGAVGQVTLVNSHVGLVDNGACPNAGAGVRVLGDGVRIGGGGTLQRNVIAGNGRDGIEIEATADATLVLGNYIGLAASGSAALPNAAFGIHDLGTFTRIGGGNGEGNVVSGNGDGGLLLRGIGTAVHANRIGTDAAGSAAVPNDGPGIRALSAMAQIGGVGPSRRNVVSGNTGSGILVDGPGSAVIVQGNHVGTDAAGTAAVPNAGNGIDAATDDVRVGGGGTGEGNLVAGNTQAGILVAADDATILGNRIGTDAAGAAALPNAGYGIRVYAGSGTRIGDGSSGGRNLVSGNGRDGIHVDQAARDTRIEGNWIGLSKDGLQALPNDAGVVVRGHGVAIGAPGRGNVISGNADSGIRIGPTARNVAVLDNLVGLGPDGLAPLGNGVYAVRVHGAEGNAAPGGDIRLGGPGAGNVFSANHRGLALEGDGAVVQGNIVGLDRSGTHPRGNGTGIDVFGAGNRIGGPLAGEGNVVAANGDHGVRLSGEFAVGNRIEGNLIGTDAAGAAGLGNDYAGISIWGGRGNTIGGTVPGAGNLIDGNDLFGVNVQFGRGNAILGNRIRNHARSGIELDPHGPTAPDPRDGDHGPNDGQNAPELAGATAAGGQLALAGRLRSTPSTSFRVEWFQSAHCSASGLGEGAAYLGHAIVATDADGLAPLAATLPAAMDGGVVTATATDPDGNTSEFSACLDVGPAHAGRIAFAQPTLRAYEDHAMLETAVVRSGGTLGAASVRLRALDGSAVAGDDYGAPTSTLLHFAPGETLRDVRIPIVLDDLAEGDEQFRLELFDATGAALGTHGNVPVTVVDHDPSSPTYGVRDAAGVEPASGQRAIDVVLTLSGGSQDVGIGWRTLDGTAIAGEDYVAASGTVTFLPGQTEKIVQVLVRADAADEAEEVFHVQVTGEPAGQDVYGGDTEADIVIRNTAGLFADGFE